MFWLAYYTQHKTEVFIADAGFLTMAKVKARMAGQKGIFLEGFALEATRVKTIPANMIGRTLSMEEASALLKRGA